VNGLGHCIAPRLKTRTNGVALTWAVSDLLYEHGGILG